MVQNCTQNRVWGYVSTDTGTPLCHSHYSHDSISDSPRTNPVGKGVSDSSLSETIRDEITLRYDDFDHYEIPSDTMIVTVRYYDCYCHSNIIPTGEKIEYCTLSRDKIEYQKHRV